jgi:hypothetical protein
MAIASEFDLSPPQVMALRQLDPDEPKTMSELAIALRCDNSNVSGSSIASRTAAWSSAAARRATAA